MNPARKPDPFTWLLVVASVGMVLWLYGAPGSPSQKLDQMREVQQAIIWLLWVVGASALLLGIYRGVMVRRFIRATWDQRLIGAQPTAPAVIPVMRGVAQFAVFAAIALAAQWLGFH